MINNPYRCVIDNQGYFVILVQMIDIYGNMLELPYSYDMKDGEALIEAPDPRSLGFTIAKWNGVEWEETATPKQIEDALRQIKGI